MRKRSMNPTHIVGDRQLGIVHQRLQIHRETQALSSSVPCDAK